MKKLISILLLAALALSLAACGSSAPASTSAPTAAPAEATEAPAGTAAEAPADTAEAAAPEAGKVLVVYYSASGTPRVKCGKYSIAAIKTSRRRRAACGISM